MKKIGCFPVSYKEKTVLPHIKKELKNDLVGNYFKM